MHFGFALDSSDIDLWNIDFLDTRLDLLDTDIPSKYSVCVHNVIKKSARHVFKISSRHVFKTSSRHAFKTSWRSLQHNSFPSSKTSSSSLNFSLWLNLSYLACKIYCIFKNEVTKLGQISMHKLTISSKNIAKFPLRARLHETWSELKPVRNFKQIWKFGPFTGRFHCGNLQMIDKFGFPYLRILA